MSPLEVEAVIESFPEVQTAVVYGVDNPERGQDVAAAVCINDGVVMSGADVIDRCRTQLSGYKVPKTVHVLTPAHSPRWPAAA